jgi:hypothetical protein
MSVQPIVYREIDVLRAGYSLIDLNAETGIPDSLQNDSTQAANTICHLSSLDCAII